jgi:16S rRNA (guanine966-N2)-methyltransferase
LRIVAGKLRGRALVHPAGETIRPTSDRVREAIFNILAHGMDGFEIADAVVIDLFAGTGALGLEALSRGARSCLFVETDAEARGLIRSNVEALGQTGTTKLYRRDATDLGPAGNREPATLVLADPPYGKGLGERALASAATGGWIADGAVVMLEERAQTVVAWPHGFTVIDTRTWGDTQASFARYRAQPEHGEQPA